MKIENYQFPSSSFLSIEKDYSLIVNKMIENQRLMKLLYYNTKDALKQPDLNGAQIREVLEKNISIVPKITIDNEMPNYIVINFDNFSTNDENPAFRDNLIIFDIVCHLDLWSLGDFQLRPYKIAGELDYLFADKRLTGIGKIEFLASQQISVAPDIMCISLMYRTVHGNEDKINMLNQNDWEKFSEYFEENYNSDD